MHLTSFHTAIESDWPAFVTSLHCLYRTPTHPRTHNTVPSLRVVCVRWGEPSKPFVSCALGLRRQQEWSKLDRRWCPSPSLQPPFPARPSSVLLVPIYILHFLLRSHYFGSHKIWCCHAKGGQAGCSPLPHAVCRRDTYLVKCIENLQSSRSVLVTLMVLQSIIGTSPAAAHAPLEA